MQKISRGLFVTVVAALLSVGCGNEAQESSVSGDRHAVSAEKLADVEHRQLTIHVPDACPEGRQFCESWLGLRNGSIGVVHHLQRVSFSIEEVDELGRFRLAAYPDCNRDDRLAAMEADRPDPREEEVEIRDYTEVMTGEEDIMEGEAPPLLGDGSVEVTAPANDGIGNREIVREELTSSPFQECRRLIVPGATLGDPVEIVDPTTVDDKGWWQIRKVEGERPMFVDTKDCPDGECQIRLLLNGDEMLVAIDIDEVERQDQHGMHMIFHSVFNDIGGAVEDTWNSGVSTLSDAAQTVGTVTQVDKLGGNDLYISAATPGARLFDAVAQEGPQALSIANGVIDEGSVFVQIGAEYAEIAGEAIMEGAIYIGEYIMLNACYLGVATGLTAVAGVASPWDPLIRTVARPYAEELATSAGFGALMEGDGSDGSDGSDGGDIPFAELVNEAAGVIATAIVLISGRYSNAEWRAFVLDIIRTWLMKEERVGLAQIIIDKISKIICEGLSIAMSPADAVTSVIHANGIGDICLDNIKTMALERAGNGDELCWAMRDEINIAAQNSTSESSSEIWETPNDASHCPSDPDSEAYLSLLEDVGCRASDDYLSTETPVHPSTVLETDHHWARTGNWQASLQCGAGQAAVGMCSSGGSAHCHGQAKELLCAGRPGGGTLTDSSSHIDKFDTFNNRGMSICPNGWVTTEFCSSGTNSDCAGQTQLMRCRPLASDLQIDYSGCTEKGTPDVHARLQATSPNDVIVGMCTINKSLNCGVDRQYAKSAIFCPIVPATNDGTHYLTQLYDGSNDLLTKYISESPWGYQYVDSFRVYTEPGTNRVPMYRCLAGTDHFASLASNCEGHQTEYLLGYVSTVRGDGKPIYRCAGGGNRRITTDLEACTSIGQLYAVLGYTPSDVCSSGECSSAPMGTSCKDILDQGLSSGDGTYYIDPSGEGQSVQNVYCDMTTEGGGWTLVTVNGTNGRPASWSNNAYPRPGASDYGFVDAAAEGVSAITSGGAHARNYSYDAEELYANSNREFMAYVGGATRDYITGTLPEGCNYFDGAGMCEENAEFFTVYNSNGTTLTTSAQACTTAARTGSWTNDSFSEFGLHLLDGTASYHDHCHHTSSSLGHQSFGRIYTTFERNDGGYWNYGVHSHWNEAGVYNLAGFLMIR